MELENSMGSEHLRAWRKSMGDLGIKLVKICFSTWIVTETIF